MCLIDYAESDVDVSHTRYVKRSRKERRCTECGRTIPVGSAYRSDEYCMEGEWHSASTCEHCCVAVQWLIENCSGFVTEQVFVDIDEHVACYPAVADAGLRAVLEGMAAKWVGLPIPPLPPTLESLGLGHG